MNTIYITALLTITLTTNEVKLGTATIGPKMFDVIGLQIVTNKTVTMLDARPFVAGWDLPPPRPTGDYWTNTYPGPFVATNLVSIPEESGWILSNTNFIQWENIRLTNWITSTNLLYKN